MASPRHLAALVGHVPQRDALGRSLTVAECVAVAAALRLSAGELARGRAHVQVRIEWGAGRVNLKREFAHCFKEMLQR